MTKKELDILEKKSWIIQVFDAKRRPNQKGYGRWNGVHCSTKNETLHQVEEHEADQYELEVALHMADLFSKSITAEDWKNFDWSVYNFRTLERIPISAL